MNKEMQRRLRRLESAANGSEARIAISSVPQTNEEWTVGKLLPIEDLPERVMTDQEWAREYCDANTRN